MLAHSNADAWIQSCRLSMTEAYAIAKTQGKKSEWQKDIEAKCLHNLYSFIPKLARAYPKDNMKALNFLSVAEKSSL